MLFRKKPNRIEKISLEQAVLMLDFLGKVGTNLRDFNLKADAVKEKYKGKDISSEIAKQKVQKCIPKGVKLEKGTYREFHGMEDRTYEFDFKQTINGQNMKIYFCVKFSNKDPKIEQLKEIV